jgi:hypothetical protein
MLGGLLYLTASRPNITLSVGICTRYQFDPKESHLTAVKRIIRDVTSTVNLGIWYPHETSVQLVGYSDADWAGNLDDRKSISGGYFYIGNCLVSWFSKKQSSISLSTAEAEYIAAGNACTQLVWMKRMLSEYEIKQDSMLLYCDNFSIINISKNPIQRSRTKHIDIRFHYILELIEEKGISLEYIPTENQRADIFTKPLDKCRFNKIKFDLGMCILK